MDLCVPCHASVNSMLSSHLPHMENNMKRMHSHEFNGISLMLLKLVLHNDFFFFNVPLRCLFCARCAGLAWTL